MLIESEGVTPEGYKFITTIQFNSGHRNGYIGVPENSPLYKKSYPEEILEINSSLVEEVDVHGEITYTGLLNGYLVGGENLWFIGFDCNHYGDGAIEPDEMRKLLTTLSDCSTEKIENIMERYESLYSFVRKSRQPENVRTLEYVQDECFKMSKQIKEIEEKLNGNG